MTKQKLSFSLIFLLFFGIYSCKQEKKTEQAADKPRKVINVPTFNADSCFSFVKQQVDFGPRVPNTTSHQKTGDYLVRTLKQYGAVVTVQNFESNSFDGKRLRLRNIIASFSPQKQKRVLLAAHWDTRPFADKDEVEKNRPIDGANDGASGVGVLLEIARVFSSATAPEVGIDMILFDGEDWGEKENGNHIPPPQGQDSWWCLGSQYWSKNKHKSNYAAYYGILLDMVGGKNARFYREGVSLQFAPRIVEKVWNTAEQLGYSHIFIKSNQGEITDDHYFINHNARIPTIDIIPYDPAVRSFGKFHHTLDDNMDLISKETLKAVGETLLHVIYYEEAGA